MLCLTRKMHFNDGWMNYSEIFLLVLGSMCPVISMHVNESYPAASSLRTANAVRYTALSLHLYCVYM